MKTDFQDSQKLAENILSLDISINNSIEKLTLIYWALKQNSEENPKNSEIKDKLSFLKSYLTSNITSYAQYNISNNLILLCNKTSIRINEQTKILRQIGLGDKEALKYLEDPIYQKLNNYYKEKEKVTYQTFNDFLSYIFNSEKLSKSFQKDWKKFIEKQLSSPGNGTDDKTIIENYQNTQLISSVVTSKPKSENTSKILSKIKKKSLIRLFQQLSDKLLLKLESNSEKEIEKLIEIHFTFGDNVKEPASEFRYIKWWGKTTQLFYFIEQLIKKHIIFVSDDIDLEDIIVKHFYYVNHSKCYDRKDIQDASGNILDNKNQKPIKSYIIDELLDDLK